LRGFCMIFVFKHENKHNNHCWNTENSRSNK
jgi:hypothetical protein